MNCGRHEDVILHKRKISVLLDRLIVLYDESLVQSM